MRFTTLPDSSSFWVGDLLEIDLITYKLALMPENSVCRGNISTVRRKFVTNVYSMAFFTVIEPAAVFKECL